MDIKKYIYLLLKIAISVLLLAYLFRKADIRNVWATIRSMELSVFIFVVFLCAFAQVVSTYRWSLFLPRAGIHMPFPKLISLYYIGMFFNIFLPTAIGGDVVKTYYLYKSSGKGGNSLATVFLDRFTGFFALVVIATVSLIFGYKYVRETYVPFFIITLAVIFFFTVIILWNEGLHKWALLMIGRMKLFGINEKVESIYNAVMLYKNEPLIILKAFAVSFIIQIIGIATFYLISAGLGMTVPIGYFYLFVPVAVTISMIPVSLAGLGLREGAFVYLFTKVGVTDAQAISISLAGFSVSVLLGLIGGIEYIRKGSEMNSWNKIKDSDIRI